MVITEKLYKRLVWICYITYLFSIIAFGDRSEFYKFSNLIFVVLVALMGGYIVRSGVIKLHRFIFSLIPFILFSFISCIWSYDKTATLTRSITLVKLFVLMLVMTLYLCITKTLVEYIYGIAISGVIVSVYVIIFYGFSGLSQMLRDNTRVGTDLVNANTLAIFLALSVAILLNLYFEKRRIIFLAFIVGVCAIIALTGSKKGILDLVIVFLVIGVRGNNISSNIGTRIIKWIFRLLLFGIIIYFAWQLPVFSIARDRISIMIKELYGVGPTVDYSTLERRRLLQAGWEQFIKTPILGVGIGASGYIVVNALGYDTYLHNNYIELLATGGVIGALLYYCPIIQLFHINWKYRKESRPAFICVICLILMIVNDLAAVQFISKMTYVLLALSYASAILTMKDRSLNEKNNTII